jgi:aspartate/methionine/tyrosine aminotransferase
VGALGAGRPYVREQVRGIAANRAQVQPALAMLAGEGLCDVPPAQGAFYYLPRIRSPRAPLDLAIRLIREFGVALIPGSAFGLEQGCHLRLSYGALNPETAAEGIERLVRGLRALA